MTHQGRWLQKLLNNKETIPNDFLIKILLRAMGKVSHTCAGLIVDGFPRDKAQGELFEQKIADIDLIFYLECPEVNQCLRISLIQNNNIDF